MIAPSELRAVIRSGLLSFPVTPFDDSDSFDAKAFAAHLEWLSAHPAAGLIVAGGTGELFSLTPGEVVEVVGAAKAAQPDAPIISGCGYGPSWPARWPRRSGVPAATASCCCHTT